MRLTPRQSKIINDMIQDEVQSIMESRRKKPLFEQGPDPMTVDMSIVDQVLNERLESAIDQQTSQFMDEFFKSAIRIIVKIMNEHAMSGASSRVTYSELYEELTNNDMMDDHQRDCFETIRRALQEWAAGMGSEAVIFAGSTGADDIRSELRENYEKQNNQNYTTTTKQTC